MFVFRKIIWCALFSWNTRFEIRPFALLPTVYYAWIEKKETSSLSYWNLSYNLLWRLPRFQKNWSQNCIKSLKMTWNNSTVFTYGVVLFVLVTNNLLDCFLYIFFVWAILIWAVCASIHLAGLMKLSFKIEILSVAFRQVKFSYKNSQKKPFKGVLKKKRSENMRQIYRLFIKPTIQERGTECGKHGECGECSLGFRGISLRIPGNVTTLRFRGMLKKIPGNVPEDSGESNFRFILWNIAYFLSNSAIKLRQNKWIFPTLLLTTYN